MTILLVSTIRRHIPYTEPSGFLYTIDLKQERILRRCHIIEPAFREVDNNPRGGLRGSRASPCTRTSLHWQTLRLSIDTTPNGTCWASLPIPLVQPSTT